MSKTQSAAVCSADCQVCGHPVLTDRAICEPCAMDDRLRHKHQLVEELDGRVAEIRRELAAARAGNGPPSTTVVRASSAATLAAVVAYLDGRATAGTSWTLVHYGDYPSSAVAR